MRPPQQPDPIVRQKSPPNIEFPFASLSDWLVPTELFFVRNHFPSPDIQVRDWRLRVDGAVERPIELDLDSIKAMRSTTFTAVVECAGNGRVYYVPPKEGLQWQNGAVGNAAWTGVLLREILEIAGVKPTAREVLLAGADSGVVDANKKTASPGPIAFARSLPLEKAIAPGTILAYSMNEQPLTRDHGYPLRAVVGGWFGMAWIKWIITVVEQPFLGYWQARDYFRWERSLGEPRIVPPYGDGGQSADRASRTGGASHRRPAVPDFRSRLERRGRYPAGAGLPRRWQGLARGKATRSRASLCLAPLGIHMDPQGRGATYTAMSRDRWGGERAARPPAFRLRELRGQLDRSGGGHGRSPAKDVRGGIRDLITRMGQNGGLWRNRDGGLTKHRI